MALGVAFFSLLAVQGFGIQTLPSFKYKYFATKLDWVSAEDTCVCHGGHLLTVDSSEDNTRAFNRCNAERCWIGFNDRAKEGSFLWVDGSATTGYEEWADGEPSNTADWYEEGEDEDCVYIHGRRYDNSANWKKWGDHPCSLRMAFICKIPVDFRYLATPMDWITAQDTCRSIGGELAHIMSPADNANALGSCSGERCWMGLTDGVVEGEYQWTDGAVLGTKGAYTSWAPSEPNNARQEDGTGEDCAYMHGNGYSAATERGKWGDHSCTLMQSALCAVEVQHKYQFFPEERSWEYAEMECNSRGGNLANIQSYGENQAVQGMCKAKQCWLGLNDKDKLGRYIWTDSTVMGTDFAGEKCYTNWLPDEPSKLFSDELVSRFDDPEFSGGNACVYIRGGGDSSDDSSVPTEGRWADAQCSQKMPFVCQLPLTEPSETAITAARHSAENNGLPRGSENREEGSEEGGSEEGGSKEGGSIVGRWFSWAYRLAKGLLLVGVVGFVVVYAHSEGYLEGACDTGTELVSAVASKIGFGSDDSTSAYNLVVGDGSPSYLPPSSSIGL
jgi:C-type mannose receptor